MTRELLMPGLRSPRVQRSSYGLKEISKAAQRVVDFRPNEEDWTLPEWERIFLLTHLDLCNDEIAALQTENEVLKTRLLELEKEHASPGEHSGSDETVHAGDGSTGEG